MENELAEASKFHPRRFKVHLLKYEITINSNEKTNIRNIAIFSRKKTHLVICLHWTQIYDISLWGGISAVVTGYCILRASVMVITHRFCIKCSREFTLFIFCLEILVLLFHTICTWKFLSYFVFWHEYPEGDVSCMQIFDYLSSVLSLFCLSNTFLKNQ